MSRLAEAAQYWPLLLLPLLLAAAPWVRRRNWRQLSRRAWPAHPSIEQASHDRGPVPGQEDE